MVKIDSNMVSLADAMIKSMTERQRSMGDTFWCLNDDSPSWMKEVAQKAHGDFLPDDWRYSFIREMLGHIVENEGEDISDAESSIEADIYNQELLDWLSSNLIRATYCDEAMESGYVSHDASLMERIGFGQMAEKQEAFRLLVDSLRTVSTEEEE